MTITDNPNVHWTPFKYSHDEYDGTNYHIFFAYDLENYTVTGANNVNVTVTTGPQPISVTAEHLTHEEMTSQGNIYAIHVVLAPYYYTKGSACNRVVKVTAGWGVEELPIDIPITTQVIQIGCETSHTGAILWVDIDDGTVYSQVPYEFVSGAGVAKKDGKYYIRLSSIQMYVRLDLNAPMQIGQVIEIHTQRKYKPAITGEGVRSQHNNMVLDGGEAGDYIYKYTIVGNAQDSQEKLEGSSTLYVWQSGSATYVRSIDIQ